MPEVRSVQQVRRVLILGSSNSGHPVEKTNNNSKSVVFFYLAILAVLNVVPPSYPKSHDGSSS